MLEDLFKLDVECISICIYLSIVMAVETISSPKKAAKWCSTYESIHSRYHVNDEWK